MILIPALDPTYEVLEYVKELKKSGFEKIVVVDDGSNDKKIFFELDKYCKVLSHRKNKGKGQAIRTGLKYYKDTYIRQGGIGVITADSDGQHLCKDVKKIAEVMTTTSDKLVLGVRSFDKSNVPIKSKIGNKVTSIIFKILSGVYISDTQTGLRGIPNNLIDDCLALKGNRFEYETEMLIRLGGKNAVSEIKIETVYLENNQGTHFRAIRDSVQIYKVIFFRFWKYILVAITSVALDIGLFMVLVKIILKNMESKVILATVSARICSATYNFLVNKKAVFKSSGKYANEAAKYFVLCAVQCTLSAFSVYGVQQLFNKDEVIVKMCVDTVLFVFNYYIQNQWIFGGKKV